MNHYLKSPIIFLLILCLTLPPGCAGKRASAPTGGDYKHDTSMPRDEKLVVEEFFIQRGFFSLLAEMYHLEMRLPDGDVKKLHPQFVLQDRLADVYTYKLVDLIKAGNVNDALLTSLESLGQGRSAADDELYDNCHRRRLFMATVTLDQPVIETYKGTSHDDEVIVSLPDTLQATEWIDGNLVLVKMEQLAGKGQYNDILELHDDILAYIELKESAQYARSLVQRYHEIAVLSTREERARRIARQEAQVLAGLSVAMPLIMVVMLPQFFVQERRRIGHQFRDMREMDRQAERIVRENFRFVNEESLQLNRIFSYYQIMSYYFYLGLALEKQGQTSKAIDAYSASTGILEQLLSAIGYDRQKISFFADKADIYERLVSLLAQEGRAEEAFQAMEQAKSRALNDLLASRLLVDRAELAALSRHYAKRRVLLAQRNVSVEDFRTITVAPASPRRQTQSFMSRIQSLEPSAVATTQGIDHLLNSCTSVIQLFVTPDRVVAAMYNKGEGYFLSTTPVKRSKVREMATRELEVMTGELGNWDRGIGVVSLGATGQVQPPGSLYDIIFNDLRPNMRQRVYVVAHDVLHNLPFAGLHDGHGYLADNHIMVSLPSMTVLKHTGKVSKPRSVLAIGFSEYQRFPSLPYVSREIAAIQKRYPRAKVLLNTAGKDPVLSALRQSRHDVIHLAGHAFHDQEHPLASGLLVPAPDGEDILTAAEFMALELPSQLVVLSACETDRSGIVGGGELLGFKRVLFFSGARAIISTIWPVDDEATATFMAAFYDQLHGGDNPEVAFQHAQLATREQFSHPYFRPRYVRSENDLFLGHPG